ncbi:hypothetical protein FWC31_00425 [Candidatus Saccharibacteria bacterium]|nr:hypothetical protein [Candidatus Saccharibacteria bacterium]
MGKKSGEGLSFTGFTLFPKNNIPLPERYDLQLKIGDIYDVYGVPYIIGLDHPADPIIRLYKKEIEQGELQYLCQPGAPIYRRIVASVFCLEGDGDPNIQRIPRGANYLADAIWGPSDPRTVVQWLRRWFLNRRGKLYDKELRH